MPRTSFRVVYRKPDRGHQLVARLDYFQNEHAASSRDLPKMLAIARHAFDGVTAALLASGDDALCGKLAQYALVDAEKALKLGGADLPRAANDSAT
jgi:hypothetical protein